MTAFGERIDKLRKDRKLTLRAMGRVVLMSHGNLNKILKSSHEAPTPPLGSELEMWFDALGTAETEEPLLRLLAAAAHVPDAQAREQLEQFILAKGIEHLPAPKYPVPKRRVRIPLDVEPVDTPAGLPSTHDAPDA